VTVKEMEGSDNTPRRRLSSGIYTKCSTGNAIPWGEVAPASEEIERPFGLMVIVRFFLLIFSSITIMCGVNLLVNLWRDKLRCASLEGE